MTTYQVATRRQAEELKLIAYGSVDTTRAVFKWVLERGWVVWSDGRYRLTKQGKFAYRMRAYLGPKRELPETLAFRLWRGNPTVKQASRLHHLGLWDLGTGERTEAGWQTTRLIRAHEIAWGAN